MAKNRKKIIVSLIKFLRSHRKSIKQLQHYAEISSFHVKTKSAVSEIICLCFIFLLFPSLGLNTPMEQKKSTEFSVFVDVMQKLPVNMWMQLNTGYSIYINNSLSSLAGQLTKLINHSENQPLKSICQACYWSGLMDVDISNNRVNRIIRPHLSPKAVSFHPGNRH